MAIVDYLQNSQIAHRGAYSAGTTYYLGDSVLDQGSTWSYINATPGAGNAPPTLPTQSNSHWQLAAKQGALPAILLSQIDASGFNAKWTAALAVIAAAGGGEIIIDQNATITTALDNLTNSQNNLRIRGLHRGITLTAGAALTRMIFVSGAQNVRIDDLRINLANLAGIGIDVTAAGFRSRGVEVYSVARTNNVVGIDLRGSNARLEDFIVRQMMNGVRVVIGSSDVENVTIAGGRVDDINLRGIQAIGGVGALRNISVRDIVFPDSDNNFQPVRIDAEPGPGGIIGVSVADCKIIHPSTGATKRPDSIAIRGCRNAIATGNEIDRFNDVNITFDGGTKGGLIEGNICRRGKWPISVGAPYDRITLGVRNERIHVTSNVITDYQIAAMACYVADDCSFVGNKASLNTISGPDYEFDYEDSTAIVYKSNTVSGWDAAKFHNNNLAEPSWFRERDDALGRSFIRKWSDTTRNNTATSTPDTELSFWAEADAHYIIKEYLSLTSSTTADFKKKYSVPAGATALLASYTEVSGGYGGASNFNALLEASNGPISGAGATKVTKQSTIEIKTGATPGLVTLDWAQQVAEASDTVLLAGSYLDWVRVK